MRLEASQVATTTASSSTHGSWPNLVGGMLQGRDVPIVVEQGLKNIGVGAPRPLSYQLLRLVHVCPRRPPVQCVCVRVRAH